MTSAKIETAAQHLWTHWQEGRRLPALPAELRPATVGNSPQLPRLRVTGFGQDTQIRSVPACSGYAVGRCIRFENSRLLTDDAQWHDDCDSNRDRDSGAMKSHRVQMVHDASNRL